MVDLTRGSHGPSARIEGPCTPHDIRQMAEAGVSHVFVNSGLVDDLSFLALLPLRELDLVRVKVGTPITPVNFLDGLVRLNLAATYSGEFKANGLTKLKQCFLEWGRGAESIAECVGIERLYVNRFPGEGLGGIAELPRLEVLRLGNARKLADLDALADARRLRGLGLYYCPKLASVEPVPRNRLVRFDAEVCKAVDDWQVLSDASELRWVGLQNLGPVSTVLPFEACRALEFFWFPESTNVSDGRVQWLADMPKLRATGFQNRRHYDATSDAIDAVIASKHGSEPWYPPHWDAF